MKRQCSALSLLVIQKSDPSCSLQVIKLSDAVQKLPRQNTCFCHGVPKAFLDVGAAMKPETSPSSSSTKGSQSLQSRGPVRMSISTNPSGEARVNLNVAESDTGAKDLNGRKPQNGERPQPGASHDSHASQGELQI